MVKYNTQSKVEAYFQQLDSTFQDNLEYCKCQVLTTDNYIILGQLTALRFIEWVSLNPGGVVALPTGKTPEFFIKWLQYYLDNWEQESKTGIIAKLGISKPDFHSLHFFQLDEFFPINPENERSFRYFVKKYYIDVLGFDPEKTHLINTYFLNEEEREMLGGAQNMSEVFPDGKVDLSLRVRTPQTKEEVFKQRAIRMFDEFCTRYENKIRDLGGIGFFLGGIGPDGHIAFNVRGSSPFSHTRLTGINYETQAAAAGDLGGIALVRKKAVITMGLETITYNPDCVAVIIAAGESKAKVVAGSVLQKPTMEYPATCLQKLPNARFFITAASAVRMPKSQKLLTSRYPQALCPDAFIEKLVLDVALQAGKTIQEMLDSQYTAPNLEFVSQLSGKSIPTLLQNVLSSIEKKIQKGLIIEDDEVILHTGPHHDDIELAYFPYLHHLVRSKTIANHFAYCTSGYTSVTSQYLQQCYEQLMERVHPTVAALRDERIETLFTSTYQDDITLYLRGIAQQNVSQQAYAVARRIARKWAEEKQFSNVDEIAAWVNAQLDILKTFEPGRKEPDTFHLAKGWLREFEAELVWAHFGLDCNHVNHLRLPFYSDDIFPHYPDFEHDVQPILTLLDKVKPTVISLALDPEGSGPDTHFKTLIALSMAIDEYVKRNPGLNLRIWGYRNVWSKFHIADVDTLIPVSLNSFAVIKNMFNTCYLSQRSADFPSYEYDGPFSELAQKVWVTQHNDLCKLLGEDYFYESDSRMMKRAYGMIYLKTMSYEEFTQYMIPVKRLLETKAAMQL
ncbi:MAG: hypothetical protein MJZ57_02955 [Bacteroidales bacterium]|nr:hypothetical protein [Bacteroidales bacterium]